MAISQKNKITNARYWVGIAYPENMIEDWQEKISYIIELPFAYCVHDKDWVEFDKQNRKVHVHIMIAFPNTTTKNHVTKIINLLSKPGLVCCPGVEAVLNIRNKYNYLIHDTKAAKDSGKHLYSKGERVEGNGFDIGAYVQVGLKEQDDICKEISKFILDNNIVNFADLYFQVLTNFDDSYFHVFKSNSGFFERLTKGLYQRSLWSKE